VKWISFRKNRLGGEKVLEAASRELFEETGLSGNPKLLALIHYLFKNNFEEVIQDEYIYLSF
jgi:8-oxo-dGTP pyrophosphatase MutT (NUDIX family)